MVYCRICGNQMHFSAFSCPQCGAPQQVRQSSLSHKRILPAALLCFFLGCFGVHRVYVGKVGSDGHVVNLWT